MADEIFNFPQQLFLSTRKLSCEVPSPVVTRKWVDRLTSLLFPMRDRRTMSQAEMQVEWERLQREYLQIITPLCKKSGSDCSRLTQQFFSQIPTLYTRLLEDARVYLASDPAAHCTEEIILCYPGFYAMMVHRIAHILYTLKIPILPRLIAEYAHSLTGIDIHPGASIGSHCYIDHGTGIVIGETVVVGKDVKIYQGVTLGATFVTKELSGLQRHPTIEDRVILYAASTILGGETVIGHDTIVGGNVWLTESVPPFSRVYHKPEVVIKESTRK